MTDFAGDPMWQQPARSYNVAAMADAATQAAVMPLLDTVAALAGGRSVLNVAPLPALHLSLYSVAPVRSVFDKEAYWAQVGEVALAAFAAWSRRHPAVTLRFRHLKATPAAVIAVAEAAEAVWDLRRSMADALPPPPDGAPQYDLIHMTLARYAQPQALPADFAARIEALPVALDFRLAEAILMRETRYPALDYETIATEALRGREIAS